MEAEIWNAAETNPAQTKQLFATISRRRDAAFRGADVSSAHVCEGGTRHQRTSQQRDGQEASSIWSISLYIHFLTRVHPRKPTAAFRGVGVLAHAFLRRPVRCIDNSFPTTVQNFNDLLAHPHTRGRDAPPKNVSTKRRTRWTRSHPHPSGPSPVYTFLIRAFPRQSAAVFRGVGVLAHAILRRLVRCIDNSSTTATA